MKQETKDLSGRYQPNPTRKHTSLPTHQSLSSHAYCELNPEYVEIAKDRLKHSLGMFLELEVVDKFPQPLDIKG